jgi:hypothetical protein
MNDQSNKSNKSLAEEILRKATDFHPNTRSLLEDAAHRLLAQPDGHDDLPFKIGDAILMRTVTMIVIGRVKTITKDFVVVNEAGWVAETARFSETLEFGKLSEFEKAPGWVLVSRGSWVDLYPWPDGVDLPKETQ